MLRPGPLQKTLIKTLSGALWPALAVTLAAGPMPATAASAVAAKALCPDCFPGSNMPGLSVHEWGTFTSLSASDGRPLCGLYVDASRLPAFVSGLPYFNYDAAQGGWASLDKLRHVTVKMETPVLYFYSDRQVDVEAKVRFVGGSITQWFPQCNDCEANPAARFVDFAQAPYAGHIGWKAKVLAPTGPSGTPLPYTTSASGQETPEWTAPRMVPSNQIKGEKGEIEQFLFYRGLGNFPNTVKLAFKNDSDFTVTNDGDEDIPWVMVYDRMRGEMNIGNAAVLFQGPMKARAQITVTHRNAPPTTMDASAAMNLLLDHMVAAGLTMSEGRALLSTWYNGYFIEGGLKAFWILPRAMIDRILPLTITPAPDMIQRVIIGRSEILAPDFERELRAAQAADTLSKFAKDKYWMAYQDFLFPGKDWSGASGLSPYPSRNPARYQAVIGRAPLFRWGAGPADALGRALR